MNKQEAIELLRDVAQRVFYRTGRRSVHIDKIVELVNQINEPQKVVAPKFVAEYIDSSKFSGWHLQKVLSRLDDDEKVGDWAYDENDNLIPEKVDMIARAWLDGYEIEQEKLYTVEIPNPNSNWKYTFLTKKDYRGVIIYKTDDDCWKKDKNNQLTESEIKKDFDFLWKFAKEVEEEDE